jgi:centrosomal protein CEP135
MECDVRYEYVRKKLDLLGYESHQLPFSAIPLISSVVDDLISTTQSLKNSKDDITQLLEEKRAWEMGNEVIHVCLCVHSYGNLLFYAFLGVQVR